MTHETNNAPVLCDYCGKNLMSGKAALHKIFRNGNRINLWFCEGDSCAMKSQMSAEG